MGPASPHGPLPTRVGIFSIDTLRQQTSFDVPAGSNDHRAGVVAHRFRARRRRLPTAVLQLWDVSGHPALVRSLSTLTPDKPCSRGDPIRRLLSRRSTDRRQRRHLSRPNGGPPAGTSRSGAPAPARLSPQRSNLGAPGQRRRVLPRRPPARGRARGRRGADPRLLKRTNRSARFTRSRATTAAPSASPSPQTARSRPEPTTGVVQLWNPSTGDPIGHPVLAAAAPIASIAFDPSGQRFATAGGPEGGLKLWFTSTLQQQGATLDPEQGTAGNAQFTPNGQFLSQPTPTATARSGPSAPAPWRTHACAVAGRNLTHEEWSRFITGYSYSPTCP